MPTHHFTRLLMAPNNPPGNPHRSNLTASGRILPKLRFYGRDARISQELGPSTC
ncbi:hypothetical protein CROQUDRAFT_669611 [Cronartium quercuum f. sp. fusiforme G11]|uniref:Uncharacterized protein n=1 Tax=Cronartium quercuum f. sp. fusiforme G11 TaxID=708437 RepID=A0A9P6TDY6_9BASI|nr:hypothetical protein CROQUDRAFT_669611 [Cronartium quercuum f. sp. fusiforme G11]